MFKTIKGYMCRLCRSKKDTKYQISTPIYGDFEARYVHACIVNGNNNYSNIILELDYDNTKEDMINTVEELKVLLSNCSIKFISIVNNNITQLFIAGSVYCYNKLIYMYYYNPKYRYNKLLCLVKNLLNEIDISKYIDTNIDKVIIYNAESIGLRSYTVYMQNISSEVSPEIVDKIYPLLLVGIYYKTDEDSFYRIYTNTIDFLFMYYYSDIDDKNLFATIYNNRNSFILGGKKYKNIFDITFKVNDQESSSGFNSDIDEILD